MFLAWIVHWEEHLVQSHFSGKQVSKLKVSLTFIFQHQAGGIKKVHFFNSKIHLPPVSVKVLALVICLICCTLENICWQLQWDYICVGNVSFNWPVSALSMLCTFSGGLQVHLIIDLYQTNISWMPLLFVYFHLWHRSGAVAVNGYVYL